ncbi:unnamed protein product, partial [Durusdinium trenchii]
MMDEEEGHHGPPDDEAFFQDAWEDDSWLSMPADETDQDVLVVQQFEESLIDVLQGDPETAACYNTYLEARRKITEKARSRGFWPIKGQSSGGKFKGSLKVNATGAAKWGHWKAECPKRFENASDGKTATTAFTGNVLTEDGFDDIILIDDPGASPNQDAACADL